MALSSQEIIDRRRLKRKLTFWRVAAVVLILALIGFAVGYYGGAVRQPHVARIDVNGTIGSDPGLNGRFEAIARDENARALIVHINSPGGTTVGSEAIFTGMRQVAENKPVISVIGTQGASGGYLVALGGDRILAHETSITGSIGVIMQAPHVGGLMEKLGVGLTEIKSGKYKAEPSITGPPDAEVRDYLERLIQDAHGWFVGLVADRRGMSREAVGKVADGRIFTGRQALELGLVDEIGNIDDARNWLAEEHGVAESLPLVNRTPEEELDLLTRVVSNFAGKTVLTERLKLDGILSLWQP